MNIQTLFVVFLSCFLTAQACSPGWLQYGNSCYLFGNISVDFLTAQDYCLDSFGCNLVHINDASENNFIKTTVQALNARAWWIGLTDMDNEGVFQWIDDYKNVTFTDWYPGQPNDYKTGEDCVDLFVNYNFAWSDYDCLKKASNPICEKANTQAK